MLTTKLLSAVAALAVAGTVSVSTSAQADSARFGSSVVPAHYYQPQGPSECWRWSPRRQNWVWRCEPQVQYRPVYPQYQYAPYYQPGLSLEFFFGGGGGGERHHRHMW
jgi:predicted RNA-binding protein with PUA-like domain